MMERVLKLLVGFILHVPYLLHLILFRCSCYRSRTVEETLQVPIHHHSNSWYYISRAPCIPSSSSTSRPATYQALSTTSTRLHSWTRRISCSISSIIDRPSQFSALFGHRSSRVWTFDIFSKDLGRLQDRGFGRSCSSND
jgi:hypothetical protein